MLILRACRLFDFSFVGPRALPALQEILHHLAAIPYFTSAVIALLATHLPVYHKHADEEMQKPIDTRLDQWDFWVRISIDCAEWYAGACEVALITPSSCTVERVFSMLGQSFDMHQESCLQDYKEIAIKLRYNAIWRKRGH